MALIGKFRGVAAAGLVWALALGLGVGATGLAWGQTNDEPKGKPLPLKPNIPGVQVNHRLILKDGTYQIVRKYEVVGDRVRYISVERGGDWEELPAALVDWAATRKWEAQQAANAEQQRSPAMEEAAALDKEEATQREDERQRMPEVAKGLNLPDADGVFVLDEFRGTPQLVELAANTGDLQLVKMKGLQAVLPLGGQRALFELDGASSKVSLHVNEPVLYLSLDSDEQVEQVVSHSITVDTHGAGAARSRKQGASSPSAGFAIVRVDQRKAVRIVGQIHVSQGVVVKQEEDVIPAKAEVLPGKHWLKLTPTEPLTVGEYALVEILSDKDINVSVWDFQVNPRAPLNESAVGPIQSK